VEAKHAALRRFTAEIDVGFRYFELLCRIRVVARANSFIGSSAVSAAGFDKYLLHPSQ
jgi:hypothetical protein